MNIIRENGINFNERLYLYRGVTKFSFNGK